MIPVCPTVFVRRTDNTTSHGDTHLNGDDYKVNVTIDMERGDIPFGKWRSQTTNFYLLDDKKSFANGSIGIFYDGNKTSVQYNSRRLPDNRINITLLGGTPYLPKIRVENQIELCGTYSEMYKLFSGRKNHSYFLSTI